MPSSAINSIILGKPNILLPRDVSGNVLSLIANKANKGQLPSFATTVFSDMSKVRNSISYSNINTNGNFVATSAYNTIGGAFAWSVLNNEAIITNLGASASSYKVYTTPAVVSGSKYYTRVLMKSNSSSDGLASTGNSGSASKGHTGSGNYETLSIISTATATANGEIRYLQTVRTGDITANPIYLKEAIMINLTALGLDHLSRAQCDELFAFTATSATTSMANDCTLNNLGGTGTSGFNSEVNANSGKTVSFLRLDGTDDYGAFANVLSLDITTNEFALVCTFRITAGASNGYLMYKGLDSAVNSQYYMLVDTSNNKLQLTLNGNNSFSTPQNSINQNIWYNVILYRNSSGIITPYINKVGQSTSNYGTTLTQQPNVRLGARSNNAGGTSHTAYFKGDIATQSIYQAPTLDINKIIKAEMAISFPYTGIK